jgi:hypothetical protein
MDGGDAEELLRAAALVLGSGMQARQNRGVETNTPGRLLSRGFPAL